MTTYERDPIRIVLTRLLAENDMSMRALARETARSSGWGTPASISLIANGTLLLPRTEAMEAIARALGIRPERFAEYEMARLREALDPRQVPFRQALATLDQFESRP